MAPHISSPLPMFKKVKALTKSRNSRMNIYVTSSCCPSCGLPHKKVPKSVGFIGAFRSMCWNLKAISATLGYASPIRLCCVARPHLVSYHLIRPNASCFVYIMSSRSKHQSGKPITRSSTDQQTSGNSQRKDQRSPAAHQSKQVSGIDEAPAWAIALMLIPSRSYQIRLPLLSSPSNRRTWLLW